MCALAETFVPREWQECIIGNPNKGLEEDKTKYKVVVAHRKSGKTVMALMYLFMKAANYKMNYKGNFRVPRFTYIGPTQKQAKEIAWDLLKDIIPVEMMSKKPNETYLEIRLKNKVIINIKGADNAETLRGPGLNFALLDEYGMMQPHVWDSIVKPELASTGGGAMFIGTPTGRNHFYDVFKNGRDQINNWKSYLLPATKPVLNFPEFIPRGQAILSPGWLDDEKVTTTEKWYNQEYECDFLDNAGTVFDRIDENVVDEYREFPENGHKYRIGYDPALREDWSVVVVLDLTDWKIKYVYRTSKIDAEMLQDKIIAESTRWTTNAGMPEIVMDTTGMGDPMYDFMSRRGLNIQPIKFTNTTKSNMVKNLGAMFSSDQIKIPRVPWLMDELKDYQYTRLESGKYKFSAPTGKHDDGVSALLLVTWQLPPKMGVIRTDRTGYYGQNTYNRYTGV